MFIFWLETNRYKIIGDALGHFRGFAGLCLVVVERQDHDLLRLDAHDTRCPLLPIDASIVGSQRDVLPIKLRLESGHRLAAYLIVAEADAFGSEARRIRESFEDGSELLGTYSRKGCALGPDRVIMSD